MSVPVDLPGLKTQSEQFGPLAYLVTVNEDGRPHVVSAVVAWDGDDLVAGAGRRTGANVSARPAVTVLWPPYEDGGYSLLVDGSGRHYVFAHIMLPHFPWVFDGDCEVKDFRGWRLPYAARQSASSSQARKDAYVAYQDQSLCMHRKVLALVDAVDSAHPGQVQFVIQGDHGPRIMRRKIPAGGVDSLDEQVRKNLLSPFVAARVHGSTVGHPVPAGASLQVLVPELLARAVQGPGRSQEEGPVPRPARTGQGGPAGQ